MDAVHSTDNLNDFAEKVFDQGRELYRDLPWRRTQDPYAIWISEVMLQQTQVVRVDGRWQRWLERFPTVDALAAASSADVLEEWQGMGYNVISMRDDWKTIYGEDVVKTGEFHWLKDYAEDRVPAETEAETGNAADVQYILYLGTNDKDTNKPVFTQAEAMERAREILISHFGGYTIQEANGGWIDGDTEYQEYTLVIYLSDTTLDAIHAAADELIETFHQSAVLIQANPTTTEFYG